MKTIQKYLEEFEEKVNELRNTPIIAELQSEIVEFGYRYQKGNELFKAVDFENIKSFLQSSLSQLESDTAKRVREETIREVMGMILNKINNVHETDCDKIVRKYPETPAYRQCNCGASSGEYSLLEIRDQLTNLLK